MDEKDKGNRYFFMPMIKEKRKTIALGKNVRRDSRGRLLPGSIINPFGRSGLIGIDDLIDALNNEAIRKKYPDFNAYVAKRVFRDKQVLIAIIKKVYPDKIEHSGKITLNQEEKDARINRLKEIGILN